MKNWVIFRGYKHKNDIVHYRDITLDDIRVVFFPKNFYEKYRYLGSVPYNADDDIFKAMEPLVIFMDYKAKPWWCPRFVLRFLYLFGMDNSMVRVRNSWMASLLSRLTKGYLIWDHKTKWAWYDLRISVSGCGQTQDLANAIEGYYCRQGKRKEEEKQKSYEQTQD